MIRVVGPGGSNPLAPTKLTFFPDLEHGRQGGAESQFDRFGRELVFHPIVVAADDLGDGDVVDRAHFGQEETDGVLVPGLRVSQLDPQLRDA